MVDDYENIEKLKVITKLDFHLALTDFGFSFQKKVKESSKGASITQP